MKALTAIVIAVWALQGCSAETEPVAQDEQPDTQVTTPQPSTPKKNPWQEPEETTTDPVDRPTSPGTFEGAPSPKMPRPQ